jgi:outer membrane protein TolC
MKPANMNKFLFTIFFLVTLQAHTQVLTYQQAVETALKNNLQVRVSSNDTVVAHNNNNIGTAGMLPTVSFNAGGTWAGNTTNQRYQTGLEINRSGVRSSNMNAGILLNWTVFDGLTMFANKDRLNTLDEQSRYVLRTQIENVVTQITAAYFEVVRQKQQINAINENIKTYQERLDIAQARVDIGKAAMPELLQARIDFNEEKTLLINAQTALANAQSQLNQLLNQPVENTFEVEEDIVFNYSPGYDELKGSFIKKNNTYQIARTNYDLAEEVKWQIEGLRYPKINLQTAYNFTRSTNQASLVLLNQNYGLNFGFTVSWTLFDGLKTHQQVKNAAINMMSQKLLMDNVKNTISLQLLMAWRRFDNARQVMAIEEENYTLAKQNVDISLERFKMGNMTTVEFRVVQQSLQDTQTRLVNARYEAKVAETDLKRVNGDLVK